MLDQRVDHRLGIFALYPDQHDVARVTFHQSCDLTVVAADNQVTFPMARHCTVFDRGWSLSDRYRVGDLPQTVALERLVTRATHRPCLPKVL